LIRIALCYIANNLLEQEKIDEVDKVFRSLDTEFNG
jgi:hypothetical protein